MPRTKIYVTGASGRLGKAVLEKLPGAVPLVRSSKGLEGEIVTDFSLDHLRSVFRDARAVIHLAGSLDMGNPGELKEANSALTWRVVDAAPGDAKIIYSSSISVYGKSLAKKPADEATKTNPDSAYARSKLDAEEVVRKHPSHVILRIGTIYGPQFPDYFVILDKIKKGRMKLIGSGNNRIPFVHVDDVAAVISSAVEKGQGTYVVAGDPLTQKQIYETAAKELGVPFKMGNIGSGEAMVFAWFSEKTAGIRGKKATMQEQVRVLSSDRVFDCSKARQELGFAPRPLEQGIREMVAAYRSLENVKNTNR